MSEKEYIFRETARRYYKAKTPNGRRAIRSSFFSHFSENSLGSKLWDMISLEHIDPDRYEPYLTYRGHIRRTTNEANDAVPRKKRKSGRGRKCKHVTIVIGEETKMYPSAKVASEDLGISINYLRKMLCGYLVHNKIRATYQ